MSKPKENKAIKKLPGKLIVISNAEPYQKKEGNKEERVRGGLTTALDPMMQEIAKAGKKALWIAWGRGEADFKGRENKPYKSKVAGLENYILKRIPLSSQEEEKFYLNASNGILWPLLHTFWDLAEFNEKDWETYQEVNKKYAQAGLEEYDSGDLIWVHDYHLMLVPGLIKKENPHAKIGFFLHTPWSHWESYGHLPWREQVIQGLLGADLLGFHTETWLRRFMENVEHYSQSCKVDYNQRIIDHSGHQTYCRVFPLGIDWDTYSGSKQTWAKAEKLREKYQTKHIIFGLDRIDYTKAIKERIKAYGVFLNSYPEFLKKVTYIQKVSRSRTAHWLYEKIEGDIQQEVGRILGRFTYPGQWTPLWYSDKHLPQKTLIAHNHISDVALVTPLIDGMNLVSKEWIAGAKKGVLIISEWAGAKEELVPEALEVNPSDPNQVAQAIKQALTMPEKEKEERLAKLKKKVKTHDLDWWRNKFIGEWLSIYR